MANPGRKDRSLNAIPNVWTKQGPKRPLGANSLGKHGPRRKGPHEHDGPLICSPPIYGPSIWVERSDLFEIAHEIWVEYGFAPYQWSREESARIYQYEMEAIRQGQNILRQLFAEEYVIFQDRAARWWSAAVEPDNWEYDGNGKIYHFNIYNMLDVLPHSFFEEVGLSLKWAATVIRFEEGVVRLRQAEKAMPLEASDDARFKQMQQVIALGFKLGADLAAISNAASRKKSPDLALKAFMLKHIKQQNVDFTQTTPNGLAESWANDMAKKTPFGLQLKSLGAVESPRRLRGYIEKVARENNLIF